MAKEVRLQKWAVRQLRGEDEDESAEDGKVEHEDDAKTEGDEDSGLGS